ISFKTENIEGTSAISFDDFKFSTKSNLEKPVLEVRFIGSLGTFHVKNLAEIFDNFKLANNNYEIILRGCKVIDSSIDAIDTFNSEIHLKRMSEMNFIPLRLWGDAMNKIFGYILQMITLNNGVILIDEIENGIHHSNQVVFWTMLFDLAKEFGVQVFATSHSAEMIQAFQAVANSSSIKGAYFELSRHAKTNKILGIKTQLDTLELKLNHHQNFRGE
ncbi:MAG: hypothetical protein RLZZ292_2000, partial [Bacteroidota bacterium]